MSKETNHASKTKKVYEAEKLVKDKGYFIFRRTSPHGLFHVMGLKPHHILLVQVVRLHKFNHKDINHELSKVQEFVLSGVAPYSICELWVWVNHKGWLKFQFNEDGSFQKLEDYGFHNFRLGNNFRKKR